MTDHSISIFSQLKMSSSGPYATQSQTPSPLVNCAINCTLSVPNVQQFFNVVNSWLLHALLDKAVN